MINTLDKARHLLFICRRWFLPYSHYFTLPLPSVSLANIAGLPSNAEVGAISPWRLRTAYVAVKIVPLPGSPQSVGKPNLGGRQQVAFSNASLFCHLQCINHAFLEICVSPKGVVQGRWIHSVLSYRTVKNQIPNLSSLVLVSQNVFFCHSSKIHDSFVPFWIIGKSHSFITSADLSLTSPKYHNILRKGLCEITHII